MSVRAWLPWGALNTQQPILLKLPKTWSSGLTSVLDVPSVNVTPGSTRMCSRNSTADELSAMTQCAQWVGHAKRDSTQQSHRATIWEQLWLNVPATPNRLKMASREGNESLMMFSSVFWWIKEISQIHWIIRAKEILEAIDFMDLNCWCNLTSSIAQSICRGLFAF